MDAASSRSQGTASAPRRKRAARIYVDGKFTTEAAFKKLAA